MFDVAVVVVYFLENTFSSHFKLYRNTKIKLYNNTNRLISSLVGFCCCRGTTIRNWREILAN